MSCFEGGIIILVDTMINVFQGNTWLPCMEEQIKVTTLCENIQCIIHHTHKSPKKRLHSYFVLLPTTLTFAKWFRTKVYCNGYCFLVRVLSYRTLRFDSGESMRTRNSLGGIFFLMIFYLVQNSWTRVSAASRITSVFQCSPIMSRAGMISLPRCVDIYTKLKLVHWTLDVHHSCSSLLSFTFKNNSLNFVQKKRKNISWFGAETIAKHEISFMHFGKNFLKNATQHAILN